VIPDVVRIPSFVVIIAAEVTVVYMFTQAFLPVLATGLGIFIPLITVNCIVFGRAEAFAFKNKPVPAILDGLGAGLGVMFALGLVGLVREILATGSLVLIGKTIPLGNDLVIGFPLWSALGDFQIGLFGMSVGAFLVLGFLIAIFKKKEKKV
jgi:electron transport complex protein RnfE